MSDLGFNTRALHAGLSPDPTTGSVIPPIYQTSTFRQDGVGEHRAGYEYSRSGNPTRSALQENLASLEGGSAAFAFASGLAAEDVALRSVLRPGDSVLVGDDAYGGTHRLLSRVYRPWGVEVRTVDLSNTEQALAAIEAQPTVVWIESPTNPLLKIVDIATLAAAAHTAESLVIVDNTFASPYLQQPLSLGADIVVHSTTKYLGGHSDAVGGAIILTDESLADAVKFLQNAAGAVAGPFDAWLTLRGIKTLGVRMERHCDNAEAVATFLQSQPAIETVYYPGLPTHPGHATAARQMRRFGGMLSVRLRGGQPAAYALAEHTTLFTLAESLGGAESLIEHPRDMTHASVAGTEFEIPGDLVRISVGLEDVDDLIDDLDQALAQIE